MPLETLATYFAAEADPESLAQSAATLAKRYDAHLIGLTAFRSPQHHVEFSHYLTPELLATMQQRQLDTALVVKKAFEKACHTAGIQGEWRHTARPQFNIVDQIVDTASGAEIVLLEQPETQDGEALSRIEYLLRTLGRPVLVMPQRADIASIHRSAVIGWSNSREARRAIFDTLMLLEPGAAVRLLNVGPAGEHELADGPMNAIAAALNRHGHSVSVAHRDPGKSSVVDMILQEASETGAGFIATGGFGHSRAFDFIIGAVSRQLIESTDQPLLLSK